MKEKIEKNKSADKTAKETGEITQKEYEEDDFGFVRENGSYIISMVCPPHAYIKEGNYYLFEKTKIGIEIPLKNGRVGDIALDKCRPFALDKSYDHPCLYNPKIAEKAYRGVCFTGGTNNSIGALMESKQVSCKKEL